MKSIYFVLLFIVSVTRLYGELVVPAPIFDLIVAPQKYDELKVRVNGVLHKAGPNEPYLLVSSPFYVENRDYHSQIVCEVADELLDEAGVSEKNVKQGVYVEIIGVFKTSGPRSSPFPGKIGKGLAVTKVSVLVPTGE